MSIREANVTDAKRIAEVAEPLRMGTEEEFTEAINREDAIWVIDGEGRFCQVERRSRFRTISVGPLLPLDMGEALAKPLLKACIAGAYRKFPDERDWRIITYIPAENQSAADSFQTWFQCERNNLRSGAVILWLPTMMLAYERSQQWRVR